MKKKLLIPIFALASALLFSSSLYYQIDIAHPTNYVRNNKVNEDKQIKNVILFIGDGMGMSQVEAAAIKKGAPISFWNKNDTNWTYHGFSNTDSLTSAGFTLDESKSLIYPEFNTSLYDSAPSPYGGSGNYQSNTCYTDSAAGGTALATGYKTTNAAISVSPNGEKLETLVEIAHKLGKKSGVVTTDKLDGATPSSFLTHVDERHKADEIVSSAYKSNANLIMAAKPDVWSSSYTNTYKNHGYNVSTSFSTANIEKEKEIFLFDHLLANSTLTPSLSDLTIYALDKLDNEEGFFLMVEGANIDKAAHSNQAGTMIQETLDFDNAIYNASLWAANRDDTLIVVTADHETGAIYFDETKANQNNIYDEVKFLSYNHSRARVPVAVYGDASEFFNTYTDILNKQGTIDKGLSSECQNYIDNTDIFRLCASYL